MRCFVAIVPPEPVRQVLARIQAGLPAGRRLDQAGLHLTLAFLGEQSEGTLGALHGELGAISAGEMQLSLAGLEVFTPSRPRVLAARVTPNPSLTALRSAVRTACRDAGIRLERERFRPHITLARFPKVSETDDMARLAAWLQANGDAPALDWQATSFSLLRSRLRPSGADYQEICRYPLWPRTAGS